MTEIKSLNGPLTAVLRMPGSTFRVKNAVYAMGMMSKTWAELDALLTIDWRDNDHAEVVAEAVAAVKAHRAAIVARRAEDQALYEKIARIEAAAPDLLDALKAMLREHDCISIARPDHSGDRWPNTAAKARAAIAKAEGRA